MADLFDLSRERRASATGRLARPARDVRANARKLAVQLATGYWPLATDQGGAA